LIPPDDLGAEQEPSLIPWHVRLRGKLLLWFYPRGWRSFWVRYWESQGISEETQMQWAREADESDRGDG
jgi:hypothetical protein